MKAHFPVVYPGFWLALWQYGVLLCAWFTLILPGQILFHPRPLNETGLGYFALGMLVGAGVAAVLLIDSALYTSALQVSWTKRVAIAVLITIAGGIAYGFIYMCGFVYGSDSNAAPALRWTWIVIYALAVAMLVAGHVYAIWRFRTSP